VRVVVSFDIVCDKRRARVVKALRAYARRVQKSVFEAADLEPGAYLRMRSTLEALIDAREDQIRYYRLCAACDARLEHVGCGPDPESPPEPFLVVAPADDD
jgi:CRISPR-associated protein Cas2